MLFFPPQRKAHFPSVLSYFFQGVGLSDLWSLRSSLIALYMLAEQIPNMNKISKAPCIKSNLDCKYGKRKKKTYVQKIPGLGFRLLYQIFLCFFGASHFEFWCCCL